MTKVKDLNKCAFDAYEKEVERLQDILRDKIPEAGSDETFNGREWCELHNIPESAFSDAINWSNFATYGVSPMYPFLEP